MPHHREAGGKKMDILDKHQLKILIDTLRNPNKWLLGGTNETQDVQILKTKFNYSDRKEKALYEDIIEDLEKAIKHQEYSVRLRAKIHSKFDAAERPLRLKEFGVQ